MNQLAALDARIAAYAAGGVALGELIAEIEELADATENEALREQVFPFIMDLEEINARERTHTGPHSLSFLTDLEEINACCIVDLDEMDEASSQLSPDDVEEVNALLAEIRQLFHDCLAGDGA